MTIEEMYADGHWFVPALYCRQTGRKIEKKTFEDMVTRLSPREEHPGVACALMHARHYVADYDAKPATCPGVIRL